MKSLLDTCLDAILQDHDVLDGCLPTMPTHLQLGLLARLPDQRLSPALCEMLEDSTLWRRLLRRDFPALDLRGAASYEEAYHSASAKRSSGLRALYASDEKGKARTMVAGAGFKSRLARLSLAQAKASAKDSRQRPSANKSDSASSKRMRFT